MSLHIQRLPSLHHSSESPELVLLHGWGMSSVVWAEWLPLLRRRCNITLVDLPGYGLSEPLENASLDDLMALCIERLPKKAVYVGYSLGGMLAVNIARRFPERVQALVTLASNVKFVATDVWPRAMPVDTFQNFSALVADNPTLALKRFSALQASNDKVLIKTLRAKAESFAAGLLTESLRWLAMQDNQLLMSGLTVPALCLFGEKDNLVPVSAAEKINRDFNVQVEVIAAAPHALFLSHPEPCWNKLKFFLEQQGILNASGEDTDLLNKQRVAESFSRAATSYDSVADLQRRVGEKLINYLPSGLSNPAAATLLDLGCGTGFFTPLLSSAFTGVQYIGLDLAEGMVSFASQRRGRKSGCHTPHWICGDAENLSLAENSIDIIYSSLAIQWCEDNEALFSELFRVLKPGGRVFFSTLGPNTLHELREAWSAVDNYVHVNRFVEQSILFDAINAAGFNSSTQWIEENITLQYDVIKQLTSELKSLGAHNVNSGRPAGLTGKRRMHSFINAYEQQRNLQGKLPASYQVWYGFLQK